MKQSRTIKGSRMTKKKGMPLHKATKDRCALVELHATVGTPQEWKKSYGLIGAIKADSKRRAISIYPLHEKKLRAGRHDKSEAALLADLAERLDMAKQFVPTFGGVA